MYPAVMWDIFSFLLVNLVEIAHRLEYLSGRAYHLCCTKLVAYSDLTSGGAGCLKLEEYSTTEGGKGEHLAELATAEATKVGAKIEK